MGTAFLRLAAMLGVAACLLAGLSRADAAHDVFIKFGEESSGLRPYVGGSKDPEFPGSNGWSRVLAIGQGALNPVAIGEVATGQLKFSELSVLKAVDNGSPVLFEACAGGGHYDSVQVVFRPQGPVPPGTPPLSLAKLELAFVTGIKTDIVSGQPEVMERITLAYGALQWSVAGPGGSARDIVTAHWDAVRNTGGAGPLPGLTLSPASLPGGFVGTPYTQAFTAAGTTAPYTYQLQGGVLPAGLTLSSAGLLSGTPQAVGSFSFRIAGRDQNASFAERSYTVEIAERCSQPPRLTGITATNGVVRFRLEGAAGCRYQVQRADQVIGPWINVGAAFAANGNGRFDFADPGASAPRFYRAINVP